MNKYDKIEGIGIIDDDVLEQSKSFKNKLKIFIEKFKGSRTIHDPLNERRSHPRINISVPVFYQVNKKSSHWLLGQSINISQNGIRLALNKGVSVGSQIDMDIKLPRMEKHIQMRGLVVWVKPSPANVNMVECGVAFEDIRKVSNKEKFMAFIADQHCRFALSSTKDYVVAPIVEFESIKTAYNVLYKEYFKRGYCGKNRLQMHYNFYSFLPTTQVFKISLQGQFVGTITLILDSPCGLPIESLFPMEVNQLREGGKKRLAEVSFLALNSECFKKRAFSLTSFKKQACLFRLYKIMFDYARLVAGVNNLVIGVHPKHQDLYEYLGLKQFGPVRAYEGACGNLALPMCLDIDQIMMELSLKQGIGVLFLQHDITLEALSSKFTWNVESLEEFLFGIAPLWNDLSLQKKEHLKSCYPELVKVAEKFEKIQQSMVPEEKIKKSCVALTNKIKEEFLSRKSHQEKEEQ